MTCPECSGRCHQGSHWERKDGTFAEWHVCQACGHRFFNGERMQPRLWRSCPVCGAPAVVLSVRHRESGRRRQLRCKAGGCGAVFHEVC